MKSRRSFVKKTAVAGSAATIAPTILPARVFGANDRINSAVLGLMAQDNVQVTTLCDPEMNILKEQDLRRVMDNKDIDVPGIASPNHWHARDYGLFSSNTLGQNIFSE